ncbi:MAG: (deoxy)nucleoside triphosphate pyrophosphohydrolase, partial [Planctomycetota bacterium]
HDASPPKSDDAADALETVEIGVAVVVDRGYVLVGPRDDAAHRGQWEFPGGKLRSGESPVEAAMRECREETGIEVRVRQALATVEHVYPHRKVILHFVLAAPAKEGTRKNPSAPFEWKSVEDLARLPFLPANTEIVAWLKSHISRPAR